jgi:hypothetical protein
MIEILGSDAGAERLAAEDLRILFNQLWPDVAGSRLLTIDIFAGAKLYGQRIKDIDILVLIDFEDAPKTITVKDERITLASACVIVETKDHDPRGVRFEWNKVFVSYDGEWADVTEKSFRQVHALRSYLRESGVTDARVHDLIWLRGVPTSDLPVGPHNIIGSDVTAERFVTQLADAAGEKHLAISHAPGNRTAAGIRKIMSRRLTPTSCDRRRMERLLAANPLDTRISEIGNKQIVLKGHGGTGKTMTLLRAAWELSQVHGRRAVILTYNKALRSDILRQFVLMGIDVGRDIDVRTVHSFLRPLLIEMRLLSADSAETDKQFFAQFEDAKNEAVAYLREAATPADIAKLKVDLYSEYGWDVVCIDEGQDWPTNERDLLRLLYGSQNIIVADGIDQLVRDVVPCDWNALLTREEYSVVEMTKSLRLKTNLGRFASVVAQELNQPNWRIDVAGSIPGGRVVIIDGDYFNNKERHEALSKQNAADGNSNVDMLFCVPPDRVNASEEGVSSMAARTLQGWGEDIWDGTSPLERDGYPVSTGQFRIVQYESCRGLEGWTVVCCDLDRFYRLKFENATQSGEMSNPLEEGERFAFRWLMIPLSRAISTLVITLRDSSGRLRTALMRARHLLPEVVEWHAAGTPFVETSR